MRTTRTKAVAALAALAALLAVGGVAYAAIPDSSGVIQGCYAVKDGGLRVIDSAAGQSCDPKRESALDWNVQGPQGPSGRAGPQGPPGSTHGYEKIDTTTIPCCMTNSKVVSISGLPDGKYMAWAEINAFGNPGGIVYCSLDGTSLPEYTVEAELSPNDGLADPVIVSAASLTGGSNTVDVSCETSSSAVTTFSALSLTQVAALN